MPPVEGLVHLLLQASSHLRPVAVTDGLDQEFAQRLYQQAAQSQQQGAGGDAAGGAGPSGSSQPSDDEVADAEIVDDDEQKGA